MRSMVVLAVTTIVFLGSSATADGQVSASTGYYTVGAGPRAICVADFNGDGELDLAVANANSGNVSVLMGVGDGTFEAAINYTAGTGPSGICAADVDGDTYVDLAVSNFDSDDVSILLNDGLGVFAAPVSYAAGVDGIAPRGICAAELNGSGLIDLAIADYWGDSVTVLINNDDGTFLPRVTYHMGTGTRPWAICAGDFDISGSIDLAVAYSLTDNIGVLFNAGDGTFSAPVNYSVGEEPRSITTADVDGNGSLDLAVANFATHNVSVLKNNGDGSFEAATNYSVAGSATRGICAAELEGDADIDLAVVTNTTNEAAILLNLGAGAFDQPALDYPVGNGPTAICWGDFDKDLDNDLAVTNFTDGTVSVLLNGNDILVGVDDEPGYDELPTGVRLRQNYPNPFNPSTIIEFSLPASSKVSITVYNVLGQKVRHLADRTFSAGNHVVVWDGRDDSDNALSGGLYFYRLVADGHTEARKMLLIK